MLAEGLPEGTNVEPLIQWLRTDGDALTAEYLRWVLSTVPRNSGDEAGGPVAPTDDELRHWLDIFREHGLDLFNDNGTAPAEVEMQERFGDVVNEFIRTHAFAADGEPVDAETVERIRRLLALPIETRPAEASGALADGELAAIEAAAAVARYGSAEAKDAQFGELVAGVVIPGWAVLVLNNEFALRHTMPGVLLETNGVTLSDGAAEKERGSEPAEALFRFQHLETLPDGREMSARSALVDKVFQRKLLGGVPVRTREEIESFLTLVADPDAAAVWAECMEKQSVDPLRGRDDGAAGRLRALLLAPESGTAGDESAAAG